MGKVAAVSLVIETKDTAKRLAEIDFELDSIGKKLREAKKAGHQDVYAGLKSQQAALRNEAREVNKALRDQSLAFQQAAKSIPKDSLTGLTTQYRELRRQIDLLSESQRKSDFGQRLIGQAKGIKTQIDSIGASVGDFRSNVGNYRGALNDFFSSSNLLGGNVSSLFANVSKAGLAGIIVGGAAQATKALFDLNKTISGLQAGVQKTTALTEAQVDSLTESLIALDTVTSIEDLLKIAEIAGRLGVQGEPGVLKFTQAIEKLSIALGDEFTGGAEQITDEVGRLSNVLFGATQDGDKLAGNVLSIGNALNVLAANGASTAPVITDFSTRISGLAVPLGVGAGEILGISATLQELGVSAERGGTAVGRIFQTLTQDPKGFAKELGITSEVLRDAGFQVDSFSDLVNTDLVGALQFASTRLIQVNGNNTELAESLKTLEINGAGELEVLLKLGQGNERLSQNINLANKSLLNQDSLTNEVKTRQENLAGATERLSNNFKELFISSGLEESFTGVVTTANDAVVAIGNLGKAFDEAQKESESFNTTVKVGGELVGALPNFFARAGAALFRFGGAFGAFFNSDGVDSFSQRFEKFFNVISTGSAKTNAQIQADRRAIIEAGDAAQTSLEKLSGLKISTPVAELTAQLNKLKTELALNPFSTTLQKQITETENKIVRERSKLQSQAAEATKKELKSVSDAIDVVAKNSIAGMQAAIATLRQKAEEAPNATIFAKLTTEADALQIKLDQTQAKFERLVDAQRGITAVVNVLPTLAERSVRSSADNFNRSWTGRSCKD
jgi:TP901 family phage tail tape measure protein